jgi:hypothetical protein
MLFVLLVILLFAVAVVDVAVFATSGDLPTALVWLSGIVAAALVLTAVVGNRRGL